MLQGPRSRVLYPEELRLIRYYDEERNKTLVFLTNNSTLAASTIAQIYKSRWQIELFFKWIKQNLKPRSSDKFKSTILGIAQQRTG
jgi:IS4 transposase